jgi:hypothetical protein
LAALSFITSGELRVPLLNISPYFEEQRDAYVDGLRDVSATGDYEPWIAFFADAVRVQSARALDKADRLIAVREEVPRCWPLCREFEWAQDCRQCPNRRETPRIRPESRCGSGAMGGR